MKLIVAGNPFGRPASARSFWARRRVVLEVLGALAELLDGERPLLQPQRHRRVQGADALVGRVDMPLRSSAIEIARRTRTSLKGGLSVRM